MGGREGRKISSRERERRRKGRRKGRPRTREGGRERRLLRLVLLLLFASLAVGRRDRGRGVCWRIFSWCGLIARNITAPMLL